jgi:hypothetical protein
MTHLQIRQRKKHGHRYFVDPRTGDAVRLCGKVKGSARSETNKYNAASCIYNGHNYDSTREAQYAMELDWRIRAEEILKWERQVPIRIEVNGHHICTTKVDFLINHHDRSTELAEVKGFETPDYQLKAKLTEAVYLQEHPEYSYTVAK